MPAELNELEAAVEVATRLSEENARLKAELAEAKLLVTPEEQAVMWGSSVLSVIDESSGRR